MATEPSDKRAKPAGRVSRALADELRAESARRKITQANVADAIGRSQGYVSERWNGASSLLVDELAAWAALLGRSPADLLATAMAEVNRHRYGLAAHDPGTDPGTETDEGHTP